MTDLVHTEQADGVARVRLDDGKANALSPAMIDAIHAALDAAEKDSQAVVLAGRPGRFCAGFDLKVLGGGGATARGLVRAGAELCLRLLEFPIPVVVACTGHAIAGGVLLVASGDFRVGARGAFKLGLNEVAIGMTLPHFGREIARARLSKRHLTRAAVLAELYDSQGAVDAGFLDLLAEPDAVEAEALTHAARLAQLDARAFRNTKHALYAGTCSRIRDRLTEDLEGLLPG